jgi:hypothetical protein
MTNKDIDRISRSWVGHIATNPDVRNQMNTILNKGPKGNEEMADLINSTVVPKDNVGADDVPLIQTKANAMLTTQGAVVQNQSNVQHVGTVPPGI